MGASGIIFSNLNDNTLSVLTADRTVAAIPFACRYRLVDFALSNMVNADITNVSVVTNYNYRSLVNHLGSGKDWDLARRSGGINLISPFQYSSSVSQSQLYATHLAALFSMREYINGIKDDVIVLSDCDNICNLDLKDVIRAHRESGAEVTLVTEPCKEDWTCEKNQVLVATDANGVVTDMAHGTVYHAATPERFINIFVLNTTYLRKVLLDTAAHNYTSFTNDVLFVEFRRHKYITYCYQGYVAQVTDFRQYFANSIALTKSNEARDNLFGDRFRPIFTNVHNSAPVVYKEGASVKDSMIADGCVIEGTVENSIIFRGVKVGRGSVVRNCILFGGTYVGENSSIDCVVADKSVMIGDGVHLAGHETMPFYLPKGSKI